MRKLKIITALLVLTAILIGTLAFGVNYNSITGSTAGIEKDYFYSYTKAVCNEKNFCQDYEILCNGNDILNMIPITGASVQFSSDWKDLRDKETRERLC